MKPILITGAAGSGKSYLHQWLLGEGIKSVDMDTVPGLCYWSDLHGNKVAYPNNANHSWLAHHQYHWDKSVLKDYISSSESEVFFGLSNDNAADFSELFSKIVYLQVPTEIIEQRLRNRDNPHGSTVEQRESVISYIQNFNARAQQQGYKIIDANQAPSAIWNEIIRT